MRISLAFATVAALLQPISGDISAKNVARLQPAKLAAMESLFKTSAPARMVIGGIPDTAKEEVKYAIHIPGLLSFLAHGDFNAEVTGLDKFKKADWPPVPIVHFAFQLMVFMGMIMALAANDEPAFYVQMERKPSEAMVAHPAGLAHAGRVYCCGGRMDCN